MFWLLCLWFIMVTAVKTGKVLVIGASMIDIQGSPHKSLIRYDSVPGKVKISHGGVGRNIAENIGLLNLVPVDFMTVLGDDLFSADIERRLTQHQVNLAPSLRKAGDAAAIYLSLLNDEHNMEYALVDVEGNARLLDQELREADLSFLADYEVVVFDCNLSEGTIARLLDFFTDYPQIKVIVEAISTTKAKRLLPSLDKCYLFKLNSIEAQALNLELGGQGDSSKVEDIASANIQDFSEALEYLLSNTLRATLDSSSSSSTVSSSMNAVPAATPTRGAKYYHITTAKGCALISNYNQEQQFLKALPVEPSEIVDCTGCGDAYTAGLATGLALGYSHQKAAMLGFVLAQRTIRVAGNIDTSLQNADGEQLIADYEARLAELSSS